MKNEVEAKEIEKNVVSKNNQEQNLDKILNKIIYNSLFLFS